MTRHRVDETAGVPAGRRHPAVRAALWMVCVALCCVPGWATAITWVSCGPEGGDIVGTVTNPAIAAEVTAIVQGNGAVYRTTTGGGGWSRIGTIGAPYLTGVSAYSFSKIYVFGSLGCYRTDNGGATWIASTIPTALGTPQVLRVHPTNGNIVYAAGYVWNPTYNTQLAFFKSLNGGQSWTATRSFSYNTVMLFDMAISRTNPNIMYLCGWKSAGPNSHSLLLKSGNGGATWSDISNSLAGESYEQCQSVAVDPKDSNRVYVAGDSFYRSATNGASWVKVPGIQYTYAVAVDPTNSSKIYAAGYETAYRSTTWGQTWTSATVPGFKGFPSMIEVAPALPSNVYLSTNMALRKSSNSGIAWTPVVHGINHTDMLSLAVSPSQPTTLFAVQEWATVWASYGSGCGWLNRGTFVGSDRVADVLIHPSRPLLVLALVRNYGFTGPIYRSGNSGAAWTKVDNYFESGGCLAQDPSRPDVVYAGGVHNDKMAVCKSQDTGITWGCRRDLTAGEGACRDIAVAKSNYLFVYAVGTEGSMSGRVFRSGNAGNTWQNMTNNLASFHFVLWDVYAVAVHPTNQYKVFVGTSRGVYVSSNGGQTWSETLVKPTKALAYDQAHGTLYAATTHDGVYYSKNEGGSWLSMNTGLGSLDGQCLGIDPVNHYLFVGTGTGSVWRTSLVP